MDSWLENCRRLIAYNWSPQYAEEIESHIGHLLRYYPKGHSAFRQLLAYFDHRNLIIPSYRTLQDMFSKAFSAEERRLSKAVSSLPTAISEQLEALVYRDDGITALNIIRADQKDFQYTAVKAEVDKAQRIEGLYEFAKSFIPSLGLSKNAIRYYADIAEQYAASRLRKRGLLSNGAKSYSKKGYVRNTCKKLSLGFNGV